MGTYADEEVTPQVNGLDAPFLNGKQSPASGM